MTTELLRLAELCEQASGDGSDRELERDIARAVGWTFERNKDGCDDDDYGFLSDPYIWIDPTGAPADGFPDYLTSLDAAMTLVPEGWAWMCGCGCDGDEKPFFSTLAPTDESGIEAEDITLSAATPALALCAASLRARSQESNHG